MKKQTKRIHELQYIELPHKVDDIIQFLKDLKKKYKELELELLFDAGYESVSIDLVGTRLETDEEFRDREDSKKADKEAERARDLRQLNALKKKLNLE